MAAKVSHVNNGRVAILISILFLSTGLIIYRLFNLTQTKHADFVKEAQSQYNNPSALITGRGNIYFSDLSSGVKVLAATNKQSYYVYANNKQLSLAPADIAAKLADILKDSAGSIEAELSDQSKSYIVIAQNLTVAQANNVNALKLVGVTAASEVNRFYNHDYIAAPMLGFVGFSGNARSGQYGVEAYYDDVLGGVKKTQELFGNKTYSDILKFLEFWKKTPQTDNQTVINNNTNSTGAGSDVVLAIDYNIQSFIELRLSALLKKWSASGGSIIVEDPQSGAILGMVSSPSFDPNNYSNYQLSNFINPNVQQVFEPGSSFKPVTMSAAINSGAVTPDTTYDDSGEVDISGYKIKNFNGLANGVQTMRQVLEHSLNTGAIFAENKTGDDTFLNYVVAFGFGQKTGTDLSGEVSGNISNLYTGRKVNFSTASFGQGIAVTPLQLVNAYSAIANGGKLMQPYVVSQVIRPDGTNVATQSKVLSAPISQATATKLQSMLVDVVDKGFDKARVAGYDIAGKTGTAQIPSPEGGYLGEDQFIHDFVGFAPAYSAKFVVLIKMDKPKGIKFAADSLSPVFGDIARYLIRYFNIPPTRK